MKWSRTWSASPTSLPKISASSPNWSKINAFRLTPAFAPPWPGPPIAQSFLDLGVVQNLCNKASALKAKRIDSGLGKLWRTSVGAQHATSSSRSLRCGKWRARRHVWHCRCSALQFGAPLTVCGCLFRRLAKQFALCQRISFFRSSCRGVRTPLQSASCSPGWRCAVLCLPMWLKSKTFLSFGITSTRPAHFVLVLTPPGDQEWSSTPPLAASMLGAPFVHS